MYLQRILSVAHLCRKCVGAVAVVLNTLSLKQSGVVPWRVWKTQIYIHWSAGDICTQSETSTHMLKWHWPWHSLLARAANARINVVHLNIPHIVSAWSRIDYCAIVGIRDCPFLYRISILLSTVSSIFIHLSFIMNLHPVYPFSGLASCVYKWLLAKYRAPKYISHLETHCV